MNSQFQFRKARTGDEAGTSYVCLKTGDFGSDGEQFYIEDPDALARIFVWPYLAYQPELSLVLEDELGVCGYALAAFDSHEFYNRYEREWRPELCAKFVAPGGDPKRWTRVQNVYSWYHNPDYFTPEPYADYPSHLHIDLLPRAQGHGNGRRMLEHVMENLQKRGSPGAHLGVSEVNARAFGFYKRLGFQELIRVGDGKDRVIYMGKKF